jgi:putative transposase
MDNARPLAKTAAKQCSGARYSETRENRYPLFAGFAIHAANIQDRDGAVDVLDGACQSFPSLRHIFTDGGYAGQKLVSALQALHKRITLEVVKRPQEAQGFVVIARRWVVERTFAWPGRCRRLEKDWESTISSAQAWLNIAAINRTCRYIQRHLKIGKQF